MEAIAKKEAIQIRKEDIDDHVRSLSTSHNMEYERLRQAFERSGRMDRVEAELLEQKTFDFLIEHAEVEDVEEVSDQE
jgi:FKBP-type peptidyl-prolyl cis-trans isomerase (trigger factor)